MLAELKKISNQLTALRLLLLPVMWGFALKKFPFYYIGIALIVCGITDILDGYFARKLNQVSKFGSSLDSWADNTLLISAIIWVAMLMPEVFTENAVLITISLLFYAMFLIVGLIKFRRFANLHLYSSKASTTVLYIFLVHAFLFAGYNRGLFIFVAIISIISALEGLLIQISTKNVNENMGSVFLVLLKESHPFHIWLKKHLF